MVRILNVGSNALAEIFRNQGGKLPCSTAFSFAAGDKYEMINDPGTWRLASSGKVCRYSSFQKQYWESGTHVITLPATCELRGRTLKMTIWQEHRSLLLPLGFKWNWDSNGLRIVHTATGYDYHPTDYDLLHKTTDPAALTAVGIILREFERLRENRRITRLEAEKNARAIENAEKIGIRVGFKDSLEAGNCPQGTLEFARKHSLDVSMYYSPAKLLVMANGDTQRVRLAIARAVARHGSFISAGAEVFYPSLAQ